MRTQRPRQDEMTKVTEQAAQWLIELESEDPAQYESFLEWISQSPRHVEAFLRVSSVDASLSRIDPERSIQITRALAQQSSNVVSLPERSPGESESGASANASAEAS